MIEEYMNKRVLGDENIGSIQKLRQPAMIEKYKRVTNAKEASGHMML